MENELLEEIGALPVIDVHEHFETWTETYGYSLPRFLYFSTYAVCARGWLRAEDARLLDDPEGAPEAQYEALLRLFGLLRHSQTEKLLNGIERSAGIRLEPGRFQEWDAWYRARTEEAIRTQTPRIRTFLCNTPGHPLCGGLAGMAPFLSGERKAGAQMKRILCVHDLHTVKSREQLTVLEQLSGRSAGSFAEWQLACEALIGRFTALGIAGFKELYLYFRDAEIGLPDRGEAERDFARLLRGEPANRALQDAMMFALYEILAGTGLPVQVHTGALLDTAETAGKLPEYMKILRAFPDIRFDLLHLNYPMLELYETVLRSCPNVWADAAWTFTQDPAYVWRFLDWALDAWPVGRTCLFGGDRHCAGEPVAASLAMLETLLADFLSERVRAGGLSRTDALEIAERWLHGNAAELYAL